MNMKKLAEEYKIVGNEFFDCDDANKIALMKLHFQKPTEIFDNNAVTKLPILSDDFFEWVISSFRYAPKHYKISLDISFDDMEGYTEEDLKTIFYKNILLDTKKEFKKRSNKARIAFILLLVGISFLVAMLLMTALWKNAGIEKDVVSYVFDIATTVTIWQAMTILIVDNTEETQRARQFAKCFESISFHKVD